MHCTRAEEVGGGGSTPSVSCWDLMYIVLVACLFLSSGSIPASMFVLVFAAMCT
jgi:hypothetical protein